MGQKANSYDPSAVEPKWQRGWKEKGAYSIDLKKAKNPYFSLVMFPYPSGDKLHVGHWYNFAPADSHARYMRMKGFDVFAPMGFDAFGLPAENYAIKTGVHPDTSTRTNVQTMIRQLTRMGCMYDWEKMVNTSSPEYYRWTQWLFLQMHKHGLAYKKLGNVNWCGSCQTVLANEQVWDGKCERCATEVIQKPLEQWFWQITKYADPLLENLDDLDWPEKTKTMQRNWIGKKSGINIAYEVEGINEKIVCFTTRPDTNFGATFIVLAPEHPFAEKAMNGDIHPEGASRMKELKHYHASALGKTELQRQEEGRKKTGAFTGFYAINNLNGRRMPIWVSDFVLAGFGTGAVVGVPGHDKRDFEFAQQFKIPVIRVVVSSDGDTSPIENIEQVQEEEGTMVNSEFLDGLPIMEAKEKMIDYLAKKKWGERVTTYRLRDWLISRQRYWGAPIPIVYDPEGKPHPIPEKHLPWLLPTDVEFKPTGESPLRHSKEFKARTEKIFGPGWTPEYDTMDTFVCSSFYYLQYLAVSKKKDSYRADHLPLTSDRLIDPSVEKKWMPVSMYIGGPEHACMHLIYARFVMMALNDFGFVSHEEPFKKLVHQGIITNKGAKMSKSKGNVVSPDSFIERHGSDVFRMYLMFMGPFTDGGDWSDTGIKGVDRFVQRVWRTFASLSADAKDDASLAATVHVTVKRVTESMEKMHFNTAISALMEFLNVLESSKGVSRGTGKVFARLLAPLAPHLAEELWEVLHAGEPRALKGETGFVIDEEWPQYDPKRLKSDTMTIAIQVNGKVRGDMAVASDASKEEILKAAKEHPNVARYLTGRPKKEMYIAGRMVSLVV